MRKFSMTLAVLLGVLFVTSLSVAQIQVRVDDAAEEEAVDIEAAIFRSCDFGASGDGCIFDVTATGEARWRSTPGRAEPAIGGEQSLSKWAKTQP